MRIDRALLLAVGLRGDRRLGAPRFDLLHQRFLVVPLVRDHHLGLMIGQQGLGLADVRLVGRRYEQLDGMTKAIETAMNLGAEPAAAAAKRLIVLAASPVPFFFAPAAQGWARTAVESRISTSKSGSRSAARIVSQRPAPAQRSNRFHWLLKFPSTAGTSSQAVPGRAIHRTQSMT